MTSPAVGQPQGRPRAARSIYLDALRAVALIRVVVYHASSQWWITAFAAMPLMFFIAGSLYAASLERRPAKKVILDRYRRILFPYWIYVLCMVVLWASLGVLGQLSPLNWVSFVMPVLSVNGPHGPGEGTPLEFTWIALWYLQFHLILSLVGPWLRKAQQRRPRAMWITMGVLFVIGFVLGSGIVVIIFYVGCWVLGYHQHDGHLEERLQSTWKPICAVIGPLGIVLFLVFHTRELRLAAVGAVLLGVFWLTLAMGARPLIEPWLKNAPTRAVVHWFSQRSLTIYMWHMAAIYAAIELGLPGTSTWLGVLAWCCVFTVMAVVAVGWAEDIAARRPPQLWPRPAKQTVADPRTVAPPADGGTAR